MKYEESPKIDKTPLGDSDFLVYAIIEPSIMSTLS